MHAAHEAGIVHRDLKPENLYLTLGPNGPLVKVLDFGIAKVIDGLGGDTVRVQKTMIGLLLGTPQYCAPEQALGGDVTQAADVYALGVTAFEMLVGRLPFDGDLPAVLDAKIEKDAPPARSLRRDLPEAVERTLARMLARDPSERIATMAQVVAEVRGWSA